MTILAVKPGLPQPDIGSLLEALANHQPVELDCTASPTRIAAIEVRSRHDLEVKLAELYPFHPHMAPLEDTDRVGVGIVLIDGPPIGGKGESLAAAIANLLENALDYISRWEHELRFDSAHQRYWGWVYRLMICGDNDHIRATLLGQEL
jgi:hypothetical protein